MSNFKAKQGGSILIISLVLLSAFLAIMIAWSRFAVRQAHVQVDQEAEERAFQASEAGVEYILFLFNDSLFSPDTISNFVQEIQEIDDVSTIIVELSFSDQTGSSATVLSRGYDVNKPGRCQEITARIQSYSGDLDSLEYYVDSWTHNVSAVCAEVAPVVLLPSTIPSPSPSSPPPPINFNDYVIESYAGFQDVWGWTDVQDGGSTLLMIGNLWKKIGYAYNVTADTVLEFDFASTFKGEIHGIGFDDNNSASSNYTFQVYGTQNWGIQNFHNYSGFSWRHYVIPVGQFYTGAMNYLTFIMDADGGLSIGVNYFRNVAVYEN